jgi:hypothetical protein
MLRSVLVESYLWFFQVLLLSSVIVDLGIIWCSPLTPHSLPSRLSRSLEGPEGAGRTLWALWEFRELCSSQLPHHCFSLSWSFFVHAQIVVFSKILRETPCRFSGALIVRRPFFSGTLSYYFHLPELWSLTLQPRKTAMFCWGSISLSLVWNMSPGRKTEWFSDSDHLDCSVRDHSPACCPMSANGGQF